MHLFKTLNRVEIFENIGFSFNCERPKREDFEHHILLPLYMLLKNAIVISIFLAIFFWWTGENDLNVVCADPHFLTTEKKSPFLKYIRIRVEVALVISLQVPIFLGKDKTKQKKEKLLEHGSANINYKLGNIKKVKRGNQVKSNLSTCEGTQSNTSHLIINSHLQFLVMFCIFFTIRLSLNFC